MARYRNAFLVFTLALGTQMGIGRADDGLDAMAESGGQSDGFHMVDNKSVTLGSISATWSGPHGSATSFATYGALSLSVNSFSGDDSHGGNYAAGSVDFGDGTVQQNYWLDTMIVDPSIDHPKDSPGTLQITYFFKGSFSVSNITFSTASGWSFITNGTLVRHVENTGQHQHQQLLHDRRYGVFQLWGSVHHPGGIAASAQTNNSQDATASAHLSLRETNITVLSGGVAVDFTASSKTGSAASKNISSGGSYAGFTLQNTSPFGHGSTVSILGGTASANKTLNATFTGAPGELAPVASDVANISGTLTDKYVLQLSYDPATANSLYGGENNLELLWLDPDTQNWVNAVAGDSDGGMASQYFTGAYNPATEFVLGDYGVDTTNHVVWAVIDHNSGFAAGQEVPEPGTWAALLSGVGMLALFRRRGR